MANTNSIENVLLKNKNIEGHPQLANMLTQYGEAIADGYEPPEHIREDIIDAILSLKPADEAAQDALAALVEELEDQGFIKPDIDVFVTNQGPSAELLINQGGSQGGIPGDFDLAAEQPESNFSGSSGIALGDLDQDGDLDAFVGTYASPGLILINQGSAQGGTPGDFDMAEDQPGSRYHDIALGDLDGDGDLDAFAAGAVNHVLINQGGQQGGTPGDFDLAEDQPEGEALVGNIALGDFDGDGDLDAFLANLGTNDSGAFNQVFINQGGAQGGTPGDMDLAEEQPEGGELASLGVAVADVDGDGDLDAFVANEFGQPNQLLINQGGGDFDLAAEQPDGEMTQSIDVALGDLDGDGDFDAFVTNRDQSNLILINQGGVQGGTLGDFDFAEEQPEGGVLNSRRVAFGDFDGDGDLDAFIANLNAPNQVLINQGGIQGGTPGDLDLAEEQPEGGVGATSFNQGIALGDVDGDGTAPVVDEYGLPNINQDDLLPSMYVDTGDFFL